MVFFMVVCCSCTFPTAVRGQTNPVFDEPFIQKAIIAAELSLLVKDDNPVNPDALLYPYFQVAQAGGSGGGSIDPHRALVAQRDGTCYVAYNGRVPGLLEELFQWIMEIVSLNLDNFSHVCSNDDVDNDEEDNNCCEIRSPVQKTWRSLEDGVASLVDACRATCGGTTSATPCPLILTGHHQGA
jgi:hypothetical protein